MPILECALYQDVVIIIIERVHNPREQQHTTNDVNIVQSITGQRKIIVLSTLYEKLGCCLP